MTLSIARRRAPHVRSLIPLSLVAFLLTPACNQIPPRRGSTVETIPSTKLAQKAPVDVVVPPIENLSGSTEVPVDALRYAFHKGLVTRRYSPLALEYVDRKVKDAAFRPGSLEEEAVLKISIERWDTSLWKSHGALTVKLTARMLDSANPTGGDLWVGRIDRRFDFGADRENLSTHHALVQRVCEQVALEVLSALPPRSPSPDQASAAP